ncbi:MAG TPA: hypothetical protein VIU13_14390 [Chryseolinea sp.]
MKLYTPPFRDGNGINAGFKWWWRWNFAAWCWRRWLRYEGLPKDHVTVEQMQEFERKSYFREFKSQLDVLTVQTLVEEERMNLMKEEASRYIDSIKREMARKIGMELFEQGKLRFEVKAVPSRMGKALSFHVYVFSGNNKLMK